MSFERMLTSRLDYFGILLIKSIDISITFQDAIINNGPPLAMAFDGSAAHRFVNQGSTCCRAEGMIKTNEVV